MARKVAIDTENMRYCHKCRTGSKPIERHHMGYDSYIGRFVPKIRKDYDKFLDCIDLCGDCHLLIHWLYYPYVQAWRQAFGFNFVTVASATAFRSFLISLCQQWLNNQIQPPPMSTDFLATWQKTHLQYDHQKSSGA